jgi:S-adenosylmethionine:tRNA ribosyltransferase-isomerase
MLPKPTDHESSIEEFDFELPDDAVAQRPASERHSARLMVLHRASEPDMKHHVVADLPQLVVGDELIVVNDSKVVSARLVGHKETGGRVELFFLRPHPHKPGLFRAMGRSSKGFRQGMPVVLEGGVTLSIVSQLGDGIVDVALPDGIDDPWLFLETHGQVPLPPYIVRDGYPDDEDRARYQTVYARQPGSVAAPTAGLHFTQELLDALVQRGCEVTYLTLHVGPGTFLPVRTRNLKEHRMHSEHYEVSETCAMRINRARREGRPILAVGTTVTRTLEAVVTNQGRVVAGQGETDIFIRPGWNFRIVDQLMTNFHLPRSTLLMLVSAFAGREQIRSAYDMALAQGYRFYSYGDGMLIR